MDLSDSEFADIKEIIKRHREEETIKKSDQSRIAKFVSYTKIIAAISAAVSSGAYAVKFLIGLKQ